MSEFVRVADVREIPPGTAKVVTAGGREIALFNAGGTFYALDNVCPHQGGPLGEGWLDGNVVACPWHGWCFDVRNGRMTLGEFASVDTFPVRVDNGIISVCPDPIK